MVFFISLRVRNASYVMRTLRHT